MVVARRSPRSVSLRVGAFRHAVEALTLSGQRASLRGDFAAHAGEGVCLQLEWADGGTTSLPSRVTSITGRGGATHVADLDVCAVEGDWTSFLEYLGPVAIS